MSGSGTGFLAGTLLGVAVSAAGLTAVTDLAARNIVVATQADSQTVNRAAKADRLQGPHRTKRDVENAKPAKIPVGCDPAFSPLSRNARNFSSRCLV
jgi:hypothetical protein